MIASGIIEPSNGSLRLSATIFSSIAPMNDAAIPSWKAERMRTMEEKALSVSQHVILEVFSAGLPYLDSNRGLLPHGTTTTGACSMTPELSPHSRHILVLGLLRRVFSLSQGLLSQRD